MVVITDERRWKNRAHIGWISGVISLLVLTVLSAGYAFALLFLTDTCAVKNAYEDLKTTTGLNRLYPVEIQPLLNTCVFGDSNLAEAL